MKAIAEADKAKQEFMSLVEKENKKAGDHNKPLAVKKVAAKKVEAKKTVEEEKPESSLLVKFQDTLSQQQKD